MRRKTYNRTSKTARHERKAQKEHQPRLPRDAGARVGEAVGAEARLLDRVDHQHAQRRADAGDPVDKLDVHVRAIPGRVRVRGGVNEEKEAQGELVDRKKMGVVGLATFSTWGGGKCE